MMKHQTLRVLFGALLTAGAVGVACSNHARDRDTLAMAHPLGESTASGPENPSGLAPDAPGTIAPLVHAVPLSQPHTSVPAAPVPAEHPPEHTEPAPAPPPVETAVPVPVAPAPVGPAPENPPPPEHNPNPPPPEQNPPAAPNPNPPAAPPAPAPNPTPPAPPPAPMPAPSAPPSMMPMHVRSAQPFAGGTAYARSGAAQAVPMQVRNDGGIVVNPLPGDGGPVTIRNDGGIGAPKLDGGNIRVPRADGGLR